MLFGGEDRIEGVVLVACILLLVARGSKLAGKGRKAPYTMTRKFVEGVNENYEMVEMVISRRSAT